MLDYPQLLALATVHRRGSFDLAAAQLGLTPSAISQRVKALEERMGTLVIRRGQPCSATEAGLRLIRHLEEVVLMEAALDLPGQAPAITRIAVNADSLATWVIPALAETDGLLFDIVIDDQDVSQDWLARGEVAGAITASSGPLQGCDCLPLGTLRYLATASPGFVARWLPDGPTPAAMTRAPALTFNDKDRLQARWLRRALGPGLAFPSHRLASSQGFVDAALAGLGWGMNPLPLVADHLAAGRLVELIPDTELDIPLFWQFARRNAPALAPLTRALHLAARNRLI
ncbi:LysR family transcriptional regulator ArgP [Gemmobacter denitrificans]|uniref:LysR family transcriptional regulator ArgP n=1 Tax=Gemmobacter denitrificans TaxID=3123040 RepID=A0ABU8BUG5_9RHOB